MEMVGKSKKLKAQQLVEFLLIAPFIVIFLGILTEYAYALNVNMTLCNGLKTVTSSVYSQIAPNTQTPSSITTTVKNNFIQYLADNNVPVTAENNIQVGCAISGQTAVFMANYTYIPAFTLPNVYFKFLPEKFNFFATSAVPVAFLGNNNYSAAGYSSADLDGIWGATDFSSLDSFKNFKKGIMKDNIAGRNNMLFLISTTAPGRTNPYILVSWNGTIKKSGTDNYVVDTADGKLYTCSATTCTYVKKFLDYLTDPANNYYNIVFVHDNEIPADLSTLGAYWVDPPGTVDLSDAADGILKRSLALVNANTLSRGNYDNLPVATYNSGITMGSTYYISSNFGSMVFIYNQDLDNIDNIATGTVIPNRNTIYNFGTKVN